MNIKISTNITLMNIVFESNSVKEYCGALYFSQVENLKVKNIKIYNNSAIIGNGGIYCLKCNYG